MTVTENDIVKVINHLVDISYTNRIFFAHSTAASSGVAGDH